MCRRGPGPGSVWSWCLRRPHPSPLWPCPPQPATGTAGGILRLFPEPLSGEGSRVCPPSRVRGRARPAALPESGCLEKGQNAGSAVCSDNRGTLCPCLRLNRSRRQRVAAPRGPRRGHGSCFRWANPSSSTLGLGPGAPFTRPGWPCRAVPCRRAGGCWGTPRWARPGTGAGGGQCRRSEARRRAV